MAVHIVKKSTLSPKLLKKFRQDEKLLYLCGANPRKDAGVVDRDGLENRCTLTGTQGSNPCLSAKKQPLQAAFFARERRDENPGGFVTAQRSAKQRLPVFPQKSSPQGCFFLVQAESSVHLILVNRRRLHPLVGSRPNAVYLSNQMALL